MRSQASADLTPPNPPAFPHRITIGHQAELHHHQQIIAWCQAQFGAGLHGITWRSSLSASPFVSESDPDFSTWRFAHEADAILFRMRWL